MNKILALEAGVVGALLLTAFVLGLCGATVEAAMLSGVAALSLVRIFDRRRYER